MLFALQNNILSEVFPKIAILFQPDLDLPRATGQGKEEEDGNQTLQVRGKSFEEIKSRYERSQEKYLDIGHLQILILSQDLTETDMWKDFFEYIREEPLAGENIYVFQTQEPEKLLGWKEGGTSVGEYITGLMENRMDREQKNGVTLRQVYYQWYQNGTLKKLPKITLSEDQIQVCLNEMHEREAYIKRIVADVKKHIDNAHLDAEIDGRVKHLFSIYKKMKNQNKTLDQIYDIFAVRIKVETVRDCYSALGIIHEMYKPSGASQMYGSVSRMVVLPVRSTSYEGIDTYWKYKENITGTVMQKEEEKLSWLRQILEWQRDTSDNKEFMNFVKKDLDLFAEQVYCFTPAGDVKNLPSGSTPIDFAYAIHTAVGNKMVGARINGRQVPIDTKLNNGDRVEIITSQNSAGPSRDWLNIVKSAQAKTKINQWFKHQFKDENISRGKELILAYCKSKGLDYSLYSKPEYQERVYKKYNFADWEATMAAVGHGGIKEGQVVKKLIEEYNKDHTEQPDDKEILEAYALKRTPHSSHGQGGIIVKGADDVAVRFSKCCSPVPGDEIIGFITRGRGISIHRTDCVNVLCMSEEDRNRIIDAEWQQDAVADNTYLTEINIYADDRSGILFDITKILSEANISVNSINSRTSKQGKATITISFSIKSVDQLNAIIAKIRNVDSIIDIERTVG